jgi:phospholipid transport system substrate-binding protein
MRPTLARRSRNPFPEHTEMTRSLLALSAVAAFTFSTVAHAQADLDAAKKRTEAFINLLLKVKSPEEGKTLSKADQEANQKVFSELDGYFDWDNITHSPIAPRADKFKPEEKAEFTKKFREVIRLVAFPDSGAFFRKAKYTVSPGKAEGDLTTVSIDAKVVKDDLQTKVDLHFKKAADGLKITDVSFDGDSLVKDYQNQMVRILDKEGPKGLIAKVDKRKAELETPPKTK